MNFILIDHPLILVSVYRFKFDSYYSGMFDGRSPGKSSL